MTTTTADINNRGCLPFLNSLSDSHTQVPSAHNTHSAHAVRALTVELKLNPAHVQAKEVKVKIRVWGLWLLGFKIHKLRIIASAFCFSF